MIIVLKTSGKYLNASYASVHTFDNIKEASAFCDEKTDTSQKWWTFAQIVDDSEEVELTIPTEF